MKCHIDLYPVIKIYEKLTYFVCEFLKVDCIEIVLEAEERATKRLQNVESERKQYTSRDQDVRGLTLGTLSNRRRRANDGNRKRDIPLETSLRMHDTL